MAQPHKPKLGQNFLVDEHARQRIVDALGDVRERTVVEIGPGHGAITDLLAARARKLVALELDPSLAAELSFRFRDQPHVQVIQGDVLKTEFARFAEAHEAASIDVVGNLPYYITSDILLHLFAQSQAGLLGRAVLMMQREVADRVAAQPGVRDYGLLSATTQRYAHVDPLFTLSPSAFKPPPNVFSSVVRLHFAQRDGELGVEPRAFDLFLHQAFAQKRKTLKNNLQAARYPPEDLGSRWPSDIPVMARAEQLSLKALADLWRALHAIHSEGT